MSTLAIQAKKSLRRASTQNMTKNKMARATAPVQSPQDTSEKAQPSDNGEKDFDRRLKLDAVNALWVLAQGVNDFVNVSQYPPVDLLL